MAIQKQGGPPNISDRPKKAAIYIRVSTAMQADRDSLPMQRQDLEAYSRLVLGIEDYVFFEDAGFSGKDTDRPAYQEMMGRIRKGEFTHLLVWKIDRISRNPLDFAEMYEELHRLRVTFVSKNEQFDTSTAIGKAMLEIILAFAELERNMTSERVSATMVNRASNGVWNGGRVPFGYDYDKEKREFSVNESEATVCRLIKDDYLRNQSLTHTARILNEQGYRQRSGKQWSPATVWIIVSSPFYAGTYRYNRYRGTKKRTENPPEEWVMIPNHHPAIFSQEEYDRMQEIRSKNARSTNEAGRPHRQKYTHVFGRLLYCGKCGSRMDANPGRKRADGYQTTTYGCRNRRTARGCDNPYINDIKVGEFVINYILNMLNAKKSFSALATPRDLESRLLYGSTFDPVEHIEEEGLNEFFNLLSRYGSDDSFIFTIERPTQKSAAVDPSVEALRKEKERQERALRRLQDLYLYGEDSISEKDFNIRKIEITSRIEELNKRLGMVSEAQETSLSDEEFVEQASHLLIAKELENKEYIYYKNLVQSVSPDVLRAYFEAITDSIWIADGNVSAITFKNGLTQKFLYKK